jgi:hypothetical protein
MAGMDGRDCIRRFLEIPHLVLDDCCIVSLLCPYFSIIDGSNAMNDSTIVSRLGGIQCASFLVNGLNCLPFPNCYMLGCRHGSE